MANPILEISDGVTSVNLIESKSGFGVANWIPAISDLKGGGVWQDSPMADGRRLVIQHFGNVVETLDLTLNAGAQDDVIEKTQKLRRLLQQAREYWTSDRNDIRPVYIKARAPYETNTRYALIYDWRTPNDANPFTLPFFNCGESTIANLTLAVERGHWQADAPLSSTCVQINNIQDYEESGAATALTSSVDFYPEITRDYCSEDSSPSSDTHQYYWEQLRYGCDYSDPLWNSIYEMAIRFRNVNIPAHARIDVAYITLTAVNNNAVASYDSDIYAEKLLNPNGFYMGQNGDPLYIELCLLPRFYGGAYYAPTPLTSNFANWDLPATTAGNPYNTPSLVSIIQELVDSSFWNTSDIVFWFKDDGGSPCTATFEYLKYFYSTGANKPVLHIEYTLLDDATYGHEDTCNAGSVFVANNHHRANLTHMYRYDASLTSYSGNLMAGAEALPFDILPATPAVSDIVYFGIDTTLENSGPFSNIVFDLAEIADDTTGKWQYYNGAWTDLDTTDNTVDIVYEDTFTVLGVRSVHWVQPTDWTANAINGVTAFWVRFLVTSVGGAPDAPVQQSRLPYSIVTPFVDIDDAQVGGDIAALSSVYIQNMSDDSIYDVKLQAKRVLCALRSKDRGANFTPYINMGGNQNLTSCVVASLSDDFAFTVTPISHTGQSGNFTPSAEFPLAAVAEILFQGEELSNYIGVFRAFIRTREYDATSDVVTAQLSMQFGEESPNFYTEEVEIESVGYYETLTDLGLFTIQPGTLNPSEYYSSGKITLYLSSASSDGTDLHVLDLILMPADEWFCDTRSRTDEALRMYGWHGEQRELRIDAIGNPRFAMRSILVNNETDGFALDTWELIASSPPMLQANKDQRLWFLVHDTDRDLANVCAFEACHAVRVFKSQRYFSMRGSR